MNKVIAGEKLGKLDAVVEHEDGKYYKVRSKQQEIRKGLKRYVDKAQGYIEGCCPIDDITTEILNYLHSQGVVIKVDGEPGMIMGKSGSPHVKRVDYYAVEPLIGK